MPPSSAEAGCSGCASVVLQVDLTLRAAPEAQRSATVTPASAGGRGAAPTPQQPQPQVAVFHAVADGDLPGAAAAASPAGLMMRVPVAVLPSPDAAAVTLRIPKARLLHLMMSREPFRKDRRR